MGCWLLKVTNSAERGRAQSIPFSSKAAAMNATLDLWKRALRPVAIIGPNDELVTLGEIEAFQANELRREPDEFQVPPDPASR